MLPKPEDTVEISVTELAAILASTTPPVRLVDCREDDEFAICKIPGATLIPLSRFPDAVLPLLGDTAAPTVVYCHHGMRSQHATLFLRDRGLKNVFSLAGGIEAWSQQIDPSIPRY